MKRDRVSLPITQKLLLELGFEGFEDGHQFHLTIQRKETEAPITITVSEYAKGMWKIKSHAREEEASTIDSLLFWISSLCISHGKSVAKDELKSWLKD